MPIAAVIDGDTYAIHSDHLNTPRKLTNANGQAVWQWGYSAFGEDQPTIARNRFANHEVTPSPGGHQHLGGAIQPKVSGAVCG
ncbi:RHS domain-containing protein [Variovorax sp. YR750]|uniref:RHS domain-containing protein n=1 Tax=Variovorax sp. YR750 TaxID=1884384 RepID=UPI001160DFDB